VILSFDAGTKSSQQWTSLSFIDVLAWNRSRSNPSGIPVDWDPRGMTRIPIAGIVISSSCIRACMFLIIKEFKTIFHLTIFILID
jgi:hypothetical protein